MSLGAHPGCRPARAGTRHPAWSPDGRSIVFARGQSKDQRLYAADSMPCSAARGQDVLRGGP